jgi:cytidine deaminase
MTQKDHLQKLISWAKHHKEFLQMRRQFHVAAIYKRNKLISIATNSLKSHPLMAGFYPDYPGMGLHAELAAIIQAGIDGDFTKKSLYVIRIDNNGNLANSKPCIYCQRLIDKLKFKSVEHS